MCKSYLLTVCFLTFLPIVLSAQKRTEWHYGKKNSDIIYSAAATNDGGYIMSGLTQSGEDSIGDIIVIKTTSTGDTEWTRIYGGPKLEGGNFIMQTADGNYLVSGHTEDYGANDCDAFLMKLDSKGNNQWLKVYGGEHDDIAEGTIELPDGSFVFSGITENWGNPDNSERRHAYIVKTNSTGDIIWSKYYAGSRAEYALTIATINADGFLVGGWSSSWGNGEQDGWLLRLDNNGDTLWTKLYKNGGNTKINKITHTIDDGYIIAGTSAPTNTCNSLGLIIKLDGQGNEVWKKYYGDTSKGTILFDVTTLPNGSFLFSGISNQFNINGNMYILATDADGNKLWDSVSKGSWSRGVAIAAQGNNGYIVAGASAQFGDTSGDMYYINIDNTVSNVTTIIKEQPRIFPNPVTNITSIILPAPQAYESAHMDIFNFEGKNVLSEDYVSAKNLVINRRSLQSGKFLLRITCNDGTIYNCNFLVE